jgi:hypothetical protein
MNERMQKLAEQAGVSSLWMSGTDQQGNSILEKYAELLIKEVHYVIFVGGVENLDIVLEHFGVEE